MILFSNGLIVLDYNPAGDILSVELPDLQTLTMSEIRRSFQIVIENIRNYDIKHLLLDSSKAVVEVEDADYKELVMLFGVDLMQTRLQRLARLRSKKATQEARAASVTDEVRQKLNSAINFRNFMNRQDYRLAVE